jgi:hypothetical protein
METTSKVNSIINYNIQKKFCELYKITNDISENDNHTIFRFLCYKLNYFIKYVNLPNFKKDSLYETVLTEFRVFPHIEFLIRNTIIKLGEDWSHTVICGNLNYELITDICSKISKNITIIKLDVDNMTQSEYSKFLTTLDFWNLIKGEKILIYQEDTIIFRNNIHDFLDYDFVGAPFTKNSNDTPNSVGNGGLSLRSKSKMIEVIKRFSPTECSYNSSTLEYMKLVGLEFPPEDVFFSKCMQENFIGIVADWDTAFNFSSESVFNENSFGGHKFWISNKKWKAHMKKIFNFKPYKMKSNINKYLSYNNISLSLNLNNLKSNAFDIDLYFFCKVNNIDYINDTNALEYIKKFALDGFIYHPKQVINIFPKINFFSFLNNIYVTEKNSVKPVQEFVHKYLYNSNFTILSNLLITKKYSCLNDNFDVLLLVFIGNKTIGLDLIERIVQYKNVQKNFNVAFCFNSSHIFENEKIKSLIKNNFDFYAVYKCKELGSDIIPTLLMYNDIIKKHKFQHILKFHTKTLHENYISLTNFITSVPLKDLLEKNKHLLKKSNCIGHPKYYISLSHDIFNKHLKEKYSTFINFKKYFVAGTIFYANCSVFDKVLYFIQNNSFRSYLLNNLYENNSINKDFSPNHFLERLFGVIANV